MERSFQICDGWVVVHDPENEGKYIGYEKEVRPDAVPVPVPGIFQQALGECHGVVWYYRQTDVPAAFEGDRRLLIRFGAVDYYCDIYVDGVKVLSNEGGEKPILADVTEQARGKKTILLALRVINPDAKKVIEGLERTKVPRRNIEGNRYRASACYNGGGITQPVYIEVAEPIRIEDVFAKNDAHTGQAEVEITTVSFREAADAKLRVTVTQEGRATPCLTREYSLSVPAGEDTQSVCFTVERPKLWSVDEPNLYRYDFVLTSEGQKDAVYSVTVGFREFVVRDGFFFLNGKRLFLKAAHTGNSFPGGVILPTITGMELKDFQLAKASGFNCIRFIATCPTPRQLDYCDRLGLMIYEESYAAWYLGDSPRAEALYYDSVLHMIRRDRNHACTTIWGLLNETVPGDAFRAALGILPALRKIDPTRLVILSSGRFDLTNPGKNYTPDFTIGSVSNPGGTEWENEWGDDGEKDGKVVGDIHGYMGTPFYEVNIAANRHMGDDGRSKPIFISECGVGSQLDTMTIMKEFERNGIPKDNPDAYIIDEINRSYLADYEKYGCGEVFADPIEFLDQSNRYNAETRKQSFDVIRSNPRFCGYNVTGLLDHSICGEGPFTYFRDFKPENFDAFREGFAPLRWCLFTDNGNYYPGTEAHLEAILANEDYLPDGSYTARFAIVNEALKPVWTKEASFTLPILDREGYGALAFPVLDEKLVLDLPEGKYTFKAFLDHGGTPLANSRTFYVTSRPEAGEKKTVYVYSIEQTPLAFLRSMNVETLPVTGLDDPEAYKGKTVLVGRLGAENALEDAKKLLKIAESGARVVFLDPLTFDDTQPASSACPLENKMIYGIPAWVYHKDCMMKEHRYTKGLRTGFMDWEYFHNAYPHVVIESDTMPDEWAAMWFEVGNFEWVTGRNGGKYHVGVLLADYAYGEGKLVLSTFPVLERIGKPVSDSIFYHVAIDG